MKRLTSYLLIVAMLISCFATIFMTTAVADATLLSVGKTYTVTPEGNWTYWDTTNPNICKDDGIRLTDGSKSNATGISSAYSAWMNGVTVEIVVDLESATLSNIYSIYAASGESGVGAPSNLTISYSGDNTNWTNVTAVFEKTVIADTTSGKEYADYKADGLWDLTKLTVTAPTAVSARFIKFTVSGSWVWLDEVEVSYDPAALPESDYTLSVTPRDVAPDTGNKLHDGVKSDPNPTAGANTTKYVGFDASGLDIVLDLGAIKATDTYTLYTAQNFWAVLIPTDLAISYSDSAEGTFTAATGSVESKKVGDGTPYESVDGPTYTPELYTVTFTSDEVITAQYIKFSITAASNNAIWLDEIEASISPENAPMISSYTTSVSPRTEYPDTGNCELIDGIKNDPDVATGTSSYVGYTINGTMDLILDLGYVKDSNVYTLYTAQNFFGVWIPTNVTVSCANDANGPYTAVSGKMTSEKTGDGTPYTSGLDSKQYTPELYAVTFTSDTVVSARYIKLTITPNGTALWLNEVEADLTVAGSTGSSYTVSPDPNHAEVRYDDGVKLTDGLRSSVEYGGANYVAWQNTESVVITLDLGEAKSTDTYSIYGPENFWGVSTPTAFTVAYSDSADGTYTDISGNVEKIFVGDGNYYNNGSAGYTSQLYEIRLTAEQAVNAQYLKFTVPANGSFIWLDEVSASMGPVTYPEPVATILDPASPGTKFRVHHVNKVVGSGEISVYTDLNTLAGVANGYGVYYQLRKTVIDNEYMVVGVCNNPRTATDTAYDSAMFLEDSKFTTVAAYMASDIFMQVNGEAVNKGVYYLNEGDIVTFTNLTLVTGDYTDTYVMGSAESGTIAGMINNQIEDTNLIHSVANVQKVDAANVTSALSDASAPANAFFSGASVDYNAIMKSCVENSVLPTIRIDTTAQAEQLIAAMNANKCWDVNVISADAAVLTKIRTATKIARTGLIYDITTDELTVATAGAIRAEVRSAPATIIVLDSAKATKKNVMTLQTYGIAVWVMTSSAAGTDEFNIEVVDALTTGANGVITASAAETSALIEKHFTDGTFTRTPTIVGHRGNPTQAIENTLDSMIAAYENGADIFELDVYRTSDDKLILFHDASFGTSAGKALTTFTGTQAEGTIENMTSAQVKQITYKDGTPITFFDEVLEEFQGKNILIFIEFKGSGLEAPVKLTANLVKQYKMENQVVVISAAGSYLSHANNNFASEVTTSYVYATTSLTGYAPQNTNGWTSIESMEENLSILSFTLNLTQAWNANLGPLCSAVTGGTETVNGIFQAKNTFFGQAATNRGIIVNPWGYGSDWNNNIGFFSNVDSITIDGVEWCTDMAKYVIGSDFSMAVGQAYYGSALKAVSYGDTVKEVDVDNTVYSIISGDAVEIKDGKLVAVKEGTAKVILGYSTKTTSGSPYTLYSEVITITVDNSDLSVLEPLIKSAQSVTVKDYNATDLATLRTLVEKAQNLIDTNSTDETAISETVIALADMLNKRYTTEKVPVVNYIAPDPNYYKWDSATQSQSSELHETYIDDGKRLNDGSKTNYNAETNAYSVWQNITVDIEADLGSAVDSDVYTAYFAYGINGITCPEEMTVSYKDANGNWQTVSGTVEKLVLSDSDGWDFAKLTFTADEKINAQYVKLSIIPSGIFVWMDEFEVAVSSGDQISGSDYIYVTEANGIIDNGDSILFTEGTVTAADNNHKWTQNIVAVWNEFEQAYEVTEVTHGNGDSTPSVKVGDGKILLAVHGWHTVEFSETNKANAIAVKEGQLLVPYGMDVATGTLGIAPYFAVIDSDHVCEASGDLQHDADNHWYICACGEKVDVTAHSETEDWHASDSEHWHECICGEKLGIEAHESVRIESDETGHWNMCECGVGYENEEHTYEWVVTKDAEIGVEGLKEHICTVCGYVDDTEVIPALPEEDNFVLGDINNNGIVDMTDYILAKRAYFGTYKLTEDEFKRGNVNFNEEMDMTDYILIKRVYFGTYSFDLSE